MQQTWYGIARKCGECDTDSNLHEVAFSADSELQFAFYCPKCKKSFGWRVFSAQLQHDAMCRDLAKCHKGKVVPITAPAILTPEDFTEEDQKLLKLMNIIPPKDTIQ
jgi:hypothetical protein